MASEVSTNHVDVLERILLDESAKPMKLPLSLLKDITNCFSSDHEIGRGGFAVVYKGVVGKGMVALKKLSNTYGIHESKFQEEVICLIQVKHKNIVRFLGYCAYQQGEIEECDGSLVMVDQRNMLLCFECACNGSLDKHITGASDGLNWRQRYQIILGICEGLRFLHEKRIVHLDLKPANILLDGQMVPKIVDFGQSRILSQVQTRAITQNIYGTRGYMSLEYIISGQITFASDIFSLGVIIIEIMKGERQHVEDEHVVESWRIRLQALEGDMQLEQVRVCYKIAIECMDLDPKKRPVAQHIVNRLDKMASVVYSGKSSIGTSQVNVLERLLFDESVEPTNLPLSLLQDITNHFSLDHQIGSGTFAVVYKGMAGKGTVAVKKLSNTFGLHENKFQEEIKCLIKAKHKNIVRFLGYCADTQGKMKEYEGNLVMEEERIWVLCFDYVCNGSLEKHITDATCGLNWRKRYQIIRGISEGLAFLHDKRILHLDLKPANILLDGHMVPKIADFGLSRCLIQAQNYAITQDISGTLGYMDPEYLRSGKVGFSSDVYSLGVIIMEILTGARRYHKDELVSLPREQSGGRVGKPAAESLQVDIKEHSEILEDVESIECLHSQENQEKLGQLSLWGGQDIMEKVNRHGTSNSTSISTGFCELSILSIYNRTAYWIFERNKEQSHFINIFRMEELRPIIMSNLIREVNSAKVYKGVVENALVAVKQRFNVDEKQLENEFIVQSQIIHKNIACFIGCCLEMDTPILVYEFLPRGTLDDILHRGSKVPLNLDVRLNIVAESAQGLAYMHSQARTKIPHGNVKPANILLDHNFMPKIAIFGLSWVMARDKEDASIVIGDMTYMDPVYMQTGLLTEKCDVYSFGVVILELISRKPTYINGVWLVQSFIEFQREGKKATELLDKDIAVTTRDLEILDCLAEIAVDCVNPDMDQRPTMTEVAEHLLVLNRSCRLHERHINTEYSEETDIGGSFVEQRKVAHLTRAVQDTNHHVRGNYSSVSTRFFKLNNLDITNWKERRNFNRKTRHTLEMSHFIKIFRKGELKPIIRSSNIIGKGPIAEVYKGLVDYTPVVVKIPINGIFQKDARFENQVIIMSQVIHRNIVRLIGCCLNVDTPMLVYEFVSQGSLDDILHRSNGMSLNLDVRLTILAESAQGLAYLHSQARVKIWHGSVKPGNILLDENFMPKISGFGLSKLIPGDEELTENIIGDWSYVDPVYMQTGLLTLKSDVYSFGVVILELISGKKPTHSDNHSLVRSFLEVHKEGKKATELFDKEIAVTAGDFEILDRLAEIAVECINLEVDRRPTMTNVAERLLMLNRSRRSQDV